MRPAVHASILRNRSQRPRPVMRRHTFSMRRLLLLAFVGAIIIVPGIVISIVGLEKTQEEIDTMLPGKRILYQVIGPALTFLGVFFLFSSCVYYYCYGSGESNRLPGGSHQKYVQGSINSDNQHHHHGHQHDHNDHHLNTPDGAVRRLSLTDGQCKPRGSPLPSPHRNPHRSPSRSPCLSRHERVPLASSEFIDEEKQRSSPPTIRVDQVPETVDENEAQVRELLVNGDVGNSDPSSA